MSIDVSGIYQELDEEGKPAIGYFRYYGQPGLIAENNPKTPFIDNDFNVAASAEQELNTFGRTNVQLFLQGLYSIAVYDKQKDEIDAVLVYRADQVGISTAGGGGGTERVFDNLGNTTIVDESSTKGIVLSASANSTLNYLDSETMRWNTVDREITGGLNGTGNIVFDADAAELVTRGPTGNGLIRISAPAAVDTIELFSNGTLPTSTSRLLLGNNSAVLGTILDTSLALGFQSAILQVDGSNRFMELSNANGFNVVLAQGDELIEIDFSPNFFLMAINGKSLQFDTTESRFYGPVLSADPTIVSTTTATTIEDNAVNIQTASGSNGDITIDADSALILRGNANGGFNTIRLETPNTGQISLIASDGSINMQSQGGVGKDISLNANAGGIDIDGATIDIDATVDVNITSGGGAGQDITLDAGADGAVSLISDDVTMNVDTSVTVDSDYTAGTDVPFTIRKNSNNLATDSFIECLRVGDSDDGFINMNTIGTLSFGDAASDYRLKSDYTKLSGILAKISNVSVYHGTFSKPKNLSSKHQMDYWIAHEMKQEFPGLVSGVKDEMDLETGKPIYQSIEWSTDKEKILWAGLGEACELIKDLTQRVVELEKI